MIPHVAAQHTIDRFDRPRRSRLLTRALFVAAIVAGFAAGYCAGVV